MTALTEAQIEYIRERIRQEGINRTDLEYDILDHLCCLIEAEMDGGENFEDAFEKVFKDFAPTGGLKRIQAEVNYISLKKTIIMKKFALIAESLVLILFFFTTLLQGIRLLNQYSWPFMAELAFVNQYAMCLFILPRYWLRHYRVALRESGESMSLAATRFMFIAGFLCSESFVNAVFFKIMHMPGGDQLFIITAILGMIYVPFYCVRKYRVAV